MSAIRHIVKGDNTAQETSQALAYTKADIAGLVKRAADGDYEAFGEIYRIFLDRIYRYVFYEVKDRMTAEDITEEIFVKAWKAIKSYRGQGQSFSAWLYRIAHNHIVDNFRIQRPHLSLDTEISYEISDPGQETDRYLAQQQVLELVSCLPSQQKQIIILKFVEGMDNREIEEITGKSQGAIRVMQMRALATLRENLGW